MLVPNPSILFIDAYDSFSNNIIALLELELGATVKVLKIDAPGLVSDKALERELRGFSAVVCGPGPGTAENEHDVGLMRRIWRLRDECLLPVLGICLGFQSLCLEFGGEISRLKLPQHGMVKEIEHVGEDSNLNSIFSGVGEIHATLYQSLCGNIGYNSYSKTSMPQRSRTGAEDLIPLAWVKGNGQDDILQAVQHKSKPFWALQYHPESICTDQESKKVIRNWFRAAQVWNKTSRVSERCEDTGLAQDATKECLLDIANRSRQGYEERLWTEGSMLGTVGLSSKYECGTMDLPQDVSIPDLIRILDIREEELILLESSNSHLEQGKDIRGRYSILGLDVGRAVRLEYKTGDEFVTAKLHLKDAVGGPFSHVDKISLAPYGGVWPFLGDFMDKRYIKGGNPDSPFWGGLMGFTTYEMGLEGIGVDASSVPKTKSRPDLSFAWITRSIVIDHVLRKIHIQYLWDTKREVHDDFIAQTVLKIQNETTMMTRQIRALQRMSALSPIATIRNEYARHNLSSQLRDAKIITPTPQVYESKVSTCQSFIRSGDSYELCQTDQTHISLPRLPSLPATESYMAYSASLGLDWRPLHSQVSIPWTLYLELRSRQPAPFAAFLRLGSATLLSSSPERFLTWDRQGRCELRPMKGTVKKSAAVNTMEQASSLLQVPKEQAENLMIVDLVRHDLHGVCGAGNVSVPRLMVVEEYASVYTMISVIEGHLPSSSASTAPATRHTGIDILANSLPPGSMTGAPKKRSCEILLGIEDSPRSLYSGVVGYMDVGGRGDFSVIIRSAFHWDDEEEEDDVWNIGAGGAVTVLSGIVDERVEMETKLAGCLGVFKDIVRGEDL